MDFHPKILNNNSHFREPLRTLCCEVLQILVRHLKIFHYSHLLHFSICMFYNKCLIY